MAFKINVSHKGKTYKLETENEVVVGKKIGETLSGSDLDEKKLTKAVTLSIEKYCGVMEMFRSFSTVKTNVFFNK
mgnify:CR=1 FL=1